MSAEKGNAMKKLFVGAVLFILSQSAQAKTLAWYRFEEEPSGTVTTGEHVLSNSVDPLKYPAYARVCKANGNNKYDPLNPTVLTANDPGRMPMYTNVSPERTYVYDTVGAFGQPAPRYGNRCALDLRNLPGDKNNPSGIVLVDDHEDLRPKNLTLEFFMRANDVTEGFRTLAVRSSSNYGTREAFRLHANVYNGGGVFILGTIRTRVVTNSETMEDEIFTYSINASSTSAIVDDNRWHHLALVVDNEAKTAKIFIDYVERGSTAFQGELLYDEGYPFAFGADPQCSYYNMSMMIDEIRLSDEARTPDTFLRHGLVPSLPDLDVADADTLFFFDFNGSQEPMVMGEDDMKFTKSVTPFLFNKACHPETAGIDAQVLFPSGTNVAPVVRASATASAEGNRFGVLGGQLSENVASCHVATNSLTNDQTARIVLPVSVTDGYLFGESLTAEMYFRLPKASQGEPIVLKQNGTLGTSHLLCMYGAFAVEVHSENNWTYGRLRAYIGSDKWFTGAWTAHPDYTSVSFADGKWHHLAFVYDKEAQAAYLYVDRVLRLATEGVLSPFGSKTNSGYAKNFSVGGSYWPDRYFTDLCVDDVRLTRGALRPYQFLTTVPYEECEHWAEASFENGYTLKPYANVFAEGIVAKIFTDGGKVPSFESDRPATVLTAGRKGPQITAANRCSLRLEGGSLTYPNRALVADGDTFTVQFFSKMNVIAPGAGVIRVNRGSASEVTEAVTWALSFADAAGNLSLAIDTESAAGQTHTFAAQLGTDAWHHVALQFSVESGNSVVSLYKDYALVGKWTLNGKIVTRPRELNLMLGAGENPSAGFDGWIDELRITPGVVPVGEFVYPKMKGFIFILQ